MDKDSRGGVWRFWRIGLGIAACVLVAAADVRAADAATVTVVELWGGVGRVFSAHVSTGASRFEPLIRTVLETWTP